MCFRVNEGNYFFFLKGVIVVKLIAVVIGISLDHPFLIIKP